MGEVRVKVKLTNAVDEALARRGQLEPKQVRVYEADALVDTGAVRSVIPVHVIQQLGLGTRGQHVAEYADGSRAIVDITEPIIFDWQGRDTLEEALVLGDEVLIGQTVLEKLDVLVDCVNQRLVPNPAHPDQPVSKVKKSLMVDMEEHDKFDKNITTIVRIITEMAKLDQIIWFGSRVRGTAHLYSDYDIALVGVEMDHRTMRQLKEALDDRLGIFTVDLVDIDKSTAEFKAYVVQSGVIVYER